MRIKKRYNRGERYLPLNDIKEINAEFLDELERVKKRLGFIKDKELSNAFQQVLLAAYNAAIEVRTYECEVDYDIKFAEIEARKQELKPWRRCWLWRLLFRPLTNRAQDIIEERAELNADVVHTAAEKEIVAERNKQAPVKTPSKRKLRRELRKELQKIIEKADNADLNEAFTEPQPESTEPAPSVPEKPAPTQEQTKTQENQLPGQLTLEDVQPLAQPTRRPRPPRNCRKPPT